MYVYRTPAFDEELARQSGLSSDHFERLCGELERMNLEQVLARFERVYPYLKRKERNLRLIARVRRVGDEQVLCWLTIFRRGDRAYEEFLRDRRLEGKFSETHLQQWLQQQKGAKSQPPQPSLPPVREDLLPWLERPDWSMDDRSSVIYESEVWLDRFGQSDIQAHWEIFSRAIATLADATEDLGETTSRPGIRLYGEGDRYLLYSKITPIDMPERRVLFLLAPFLERPSTAAMEDVLDWVWGQEANVSLDAIAVDELTAVARRAYPSYLLADEENWRLLENEDRANLALSAEEEGILLAVSTKQPSLPLFLNGQAGSGKSTMLFHLFADYCHRHLHYAVQQDRGILDKPHPLFLAYNDRLLKVAQERVAALLASHHHFSERRGESEQLQDISPFFQTFRSFLRNLLPLEVRDRFGDANYISFHRFRQLCGKTRRNYSPERCWQVIRTFIKGYHLDERDTYLEIEDYHEVPKKERTVSPEEFAGIYNTVWKWYERYTQAEKLWDDQDLIRTILNHKCYRPEYTAIFCDEAQDFTRLELQLILRLSVFSNYDLEHQYLECLPFAFAGDPLQTLNPTGFRWESLKAAFYNEVITALSPTGKLGLEMNFTELECNYRSIPAIVGVNNLIQLWRSILFDLPDLEPQKSRKKGNFEPQKLIIGENVSTDELRIYLQDALVIIPCDEGGELDYARQDEVLQHLISEDIDFINSPWNVLSAIAAKGLEFKQVILYKFGEACPENAWQTQDRASAAIKYFFNKLYVATSRTTERLFIVDTNLGEQRLWQRASSQENLEKFLQRLSKPKQREKWRGRLHLIQRGNRPNLLRTDDLPVIAQTFETQGIATENSELLRRAQGAYKRLNSECDALRCEAFALKLEGNFVEAGRKFIRQGNLEQAWECFWQGMDWETLLDLSEQHQKIAGFQFSIPSEQISIARFLVREDSLLESVREFSHLLEGEIDRGELQSHHFSPQWQTAIKVYGERIEALIQAAQSSPDNLAEINDEWQRWGTILQHLAEAKYQGMGERAAQCFYLAKNYEKAVQCWEQIGETQATEYNLAKARLLGLPNGLEYLLKAQHYDRILALWRQTNQPREFQWLQAVAPALEHKNQFLNALIVYSWLDDLGRVKTCFTQTLQQESGVKALKCLLQYTIAGQHWDEAIAALETHRNLLLSPEAEKMGLKYLIVGFFAHSPLTPNTLDSDRRQRLENFIKQEILPTTWRKYLSIPHIGIALEKIGALVETLEFYEGYVSDRNTELSTFARDRWLATKTRQEQYSRKQQQIAKADRIQGEIRRRAKRWGVRLQEISLVPPVPPKLPPIPKTAPKISGLPPEINIPSPTPPIFQFRLRHLMVKIIFSTQQVLIRDILRDRQLCIDGSLQQVQMDDLTLHSFGDRLTFNVPNSGYSGVLIHQNPTSRLELTLQGFSQKIAIELC